MKKIFLALALIFTCSISSQTWKYKSGGNAFDGKYKTSYVVGKGSHFPYHKPLLAINMYNEESLNFYISSAGYFYDDSNTEVLWVFSNEPDIIYETIDFTISKDNKDIFLNLFKGSDDSYLMQLEFIEKLKAASKVSVRIKDKNSQNDITFSLSGSTKAINYAISVKYINNFKLAMKLVEEKEEKLKAEKKEKLRKATIKVNELLSHYELTQKEKENIFAKLGYQSSFSNFTLSNIDSLNISVFKGTTEFSIFNNLGELLYKFSDIQDVIPLYSLNVRSKAKLYDKMLVSKNIERLKLLFKQDGVDDFELEQIFILLKKEIDSYSNLNFKVVDSFTLALPSKNYSFPRLILYKPDGRRIHTIKTIDAYAPKYINKHIVNRNILCNSKIHNILSRYVFSSKDLSIIDAKLNEIDVFNFEPVDIVNCVATFSSYDKTQTIFKFKDKYFEDIFSFSIYDKSFTKALKKQIESDN